MSVELRLLKDAATGQPFVPVTHWDAVSNKPNIDGSLNSINASLNALDVSIKALDASIRNIDIDIPIKSITGEAGLAEYANSEFVAVSVSEPDENGNVNVDASVKVVTLADASNGYDGLASASDIYNNLSNTEEVITNAFIKIANTTGLNSSLNLVWSEESGLSEDTIKDAIEYVSMNTGAKINDSSINVSETWSSQKINDLSTNLYNNINNIDGRVNNLNTSVSDLNNRIETAEGELSDLDEFTCGTIEPTTTNFVEDTSYTIHEALLRTANLFEGYQKEIDDINDLIPNQATEQNQLADKDFVNSTVATNAANFRGNWDNWTSVPIDASQYPEDYVGNRTPTNNDYMVIQDASDYFASYQGSWRFIYVGIWNTDGKPGWHPQYKIGSSFTAAQQDALDSGITSAKVSNYDNYDASIDALQTDKLDKVYTANKIYGTNAEGNQISYTAGTGISFANGQISNTNTDAAWGNITGTLSNLTDLSTALDAKLDVLTPGSNISIDNGVISATDTTYSVATQLANGLMSSTDKTKLDGLSNYTLPTASANTLGGIKVGSNLSIDANGVLSAQAVQTLTEGDGIDITNNVVSVDTSVIQPKLTAGEGITIINNVIAATGGGSGGTHTTYLFSDADASAGIYSTDIQNFYIACIGNQTIQDVMISIDETYTDPSTGETAIAHNFYYPSAQRMYEGNVELWLFYTEDCVTWENRYYLINSTVTRTITTGTFGVQNS